MAAELLRCCAFVHPDTIPEELFTAGVAHLGTGLQQMRRDPLAFDEAIRVLLAYSLIHRDPTTATLSIHRLVQAILIDALPAKTKKLWRERVIRALNQVFPEKMFEEWTICGHLLPHVLVCVTWIEQGLVPPTSAEAHVLHKAGNYLRERGQYKDAEPLLTQALAIHELQLGADHPDTATSLNSLARLYRSQGKYREAEPLLKRALAIREQQLGTDHLSTATSLNHLAGLYRMEGKYLEAEPLLKRALTIREQRLGFNHPDTAQSLNSLAYLYLVQGKYAEAITQLQLAAAVQPNDAETHQALLACFDKQGDKPGAVIGQGQFTKECGRPRPRVSWVTPRRISRCCSWRRADGGVRAPFPTFMKWPW